MVKEQASTLILGVAVIEDIIIISILAILQSITSTGVGQVSVGELVISILSVLAFIGGVLYIGLDTVPKFVNYIGSTNQPDLLIVAVLGVAFGLSFVAYELGISVATGAFFAGVLIAESKVHSVTKVLATPIRDMFARFIFRFGWCANGHPTSAYFHSSCYCIGSDILGGKIPYCLYICKDTRIQYIDCTEDWLWVGFLWR